MTFNPFGDRDTRGYLRNRLGTNDPALIARLEAHAVAAHVLPALAVPKVALTVGYDQVLDTHHRLFSCRKFHTLTDVAVSRALSASLPNRPAVIP